mmetsp:Transcript_18982/g.31914  ORF Transcript_18982/g.31914 Transcript_18982/m.31914 type:complete len:128 (-) Transcript_18982:257-640(-)|eukprot:CAMPEP_0198198116 /NCGR_PEP_ID=MMETSP1445-20131203/1609_1 /TAXON_ID=36898 /ORGANISM="Pyramimonas sp., Strain CCMP2087" /LENGTH=127 /DNA_ID=CAMNT_0043867581 /DNA_START=118 /DNA_END=501 /DNA_ORIENTATION=-
MSAFAMSSAVLCPVQSVRASVRASAPQRSLRLDVSSVKQSVEGKVISTKGTQTAIVVVSRRFPDPKYGKMTSSSKKYHAHDDLEIAKLGDVVRLESTGRPLSKTKRWIVTEVCGQKGCDPNQNAESK